ncbi:hypothetical protein VTJ49DRAFT_536 [Mycothermus thermophilus]|uniref:Uncharacterized protein n=1 Tax=Humicola insolens TaxID=85995 RepID=A0ABR3VGF0_HUMIN
MAFIQDPRLRQTWNQLSHTTEAVTSDAAAGIWAFGHAYVNPCLSSLAAAIDAWCCAPCLGDRDERARRSAAAAARRRTRAARAEYSFDFYDDWEDDFAADFLGDVAGDGDDADVDEPLARAAPSRGILGADWERLLAGTGVVGAHRGIGGGGAGAGDIVDQPRRRRGMSYGTRGTGRRKASGEEDPNVIPRTAPLGFLARLPFKIVGSLRYKPSAANLREHPGGGGTGRRGDGGIAGGEEREPLLGRSADSEADHRHVRRGKRARSDTTTSGDTSSSYRSRGDLFPSDGEGDEDAVPLSDEFAMALERVDDRGSTRTRSSKGKRRADSDKGLLSRTGSRSTMSMSSSMHSSRDEFGRDSGVFASPAEAHSYAEADTETEDDTAATVRVPWLEDLRREEEEAEREEYEGIERRRKAASHLAIQRGLSKEESASGLEVEAADEVKHNAPPPRVGDHHGDADPAGDMAIPSPPPNDDVVDEQKPPPVTPPESGSSPPPAVVPVKMNGSPPPTESTFVAARLPHFG